MKLRELHPREAISETMHRIYTFGMTTTSGGNISIREPDGTIWITPSAVDKGGLRPEEIATVLPDGTVEGPYPPSSELPFHRAIYEARPEMGAIIHAHSPALVSFSIVRQVPNTTIIPQAHQLCGDVGYAPYELPGSRELGASIAESFRSGATSVIMENHGTVVAGSDLGHCFQRFETLEFCARIQIEAAGIGEPKGLTAEQLSLMSEEPRPLAERKPHTPSAKELALRGSMIEMVRRAYRQRLIISTYGTFSARIADDAFVVTPYGEDRYLLDRRDLVHVNRRGQEPGKLPSRSVRLHQRIYRDHPEIGAVITAQAPSATAYAVVGAELDTRTIPESYILLRDIPLLPFGDQFREGKEVSASLSEKRPILLLENDALLVTGGSVAETFDRLEVLEFSARSLNQSRPLGKLVPISDEEIKKLRGKFFGEFG
ncbi:MAG: class II aldolase/adducin family protein [Alkalispirochaetaceae bacterium]